MWDVVVGFYSVLKIFLFNYRFKSPSSSELYQIGNSSLVQLTLSPPVRNFVACSSCLLMFLVAYIANNMHPDQTTRSVQCTPADNARKRAPGSI